VSVHAVEEPEADPALEPFLALLARHIASTPVALSPFTADYAIFARMLAHGNPPDNWPSLLAAAQDPAAIQRLAATIPRP
jgi:hypothetical protein